MENRKQIVSKVKGVYKSSMSLHTDEEMTPEVLKRFPGCEHFTDDQAKEIVFTIKQLAELLYDLALPKELHNVSYQSSDGKEFILDDDEDLSNLNRAA